MASTTRQALLQALSAAEGAYISGQQLAQQLGVSRAAVHKAAAALTTQGYALEAGGTVCWAATPSAPRRSAPTPPRCSCTTRWKAPTAPQSCWRWKALSTAL